MKDDILMWLSPVAKIISYKDVDAWKIEKQFKQYYYNDSWIVIKSANVTFDPITADEKSLDYAISLVL